MKTKLTSFGFLLVVVILGLNVSTSVVSASEVTFSANSGICERFSLSRLLPSCRITPPPPPVDVCPNVPGDQSSGPCADIQCAQNGGTWNGTSCDIPTPPPPSSGGERGRDICARYGLSSRIPTPQSCDVCPNVPGIQTEQPCLDEVCVQTGGWWIDASCHFAPRLFLTYPNGGEVFTVGDVIEIQWEGDDADSCFIVQIDPDGLLESEQIIDNLPGTQHSFTWTVDQMGGGTNEPQQQRIYIHCSKGPVAGIDSSESSFTVKPKPPVDICPNVSGNQTSEPCADTTCVANGGTWKNGSLCVIPPPPSFTKACGDGIDNDSDGKIDLADAGCTDLQDNDETGPSGGAGGGAGAGGGGGGGSSGGGSAITTQSLLRDRSAR